MLNIEITPDQRNRVSQEWGKIAGEELEILCSSITNPIYALGSELGILRLKNKMVKGYMGFSEAMSKWYYTNH